MSKSNSYQTLQACGLVIAVGASLAACTATGASNPSFQQDVMPILAANCVRCHSYPTLGGAPEYFRLDVFGDVIVRDGRPRSAAEGPCGVTPLDARAVICGAASLASLSASRVASDKRPMPPRFRIEDHQIATLDAWALQPERGPARPTNHVPSVQLLQLPTVAGVTQLEVTVTDEDRDLVVGELWVELAGDSRFVAPLRSGTARVTWATAGLPQGTFTATARLDDGAMVHQLMAGQLTIGGQ